MIDENRGHDNSSTSHTPPADDKPLSDAEMAGLTDEEKAELAAADDKTTDEGEKGAEDAGAAKEGDDDPAETAAADGDDLDDLPPLDEGPAQIVTDPSDAEALRWAHVDFNAEMAKLEAEKKDLTEQHSNGEVSDAELFDKREALLERRAELRDRSKDVELYNARQADADKLFNEAQATFFDDKENSKYLENPLLKGFFAQTMDEVARQGESAGKSYLWMLQQTKRQVEIGLGTIRTRRDEAAATPTPADEDKDKKPSRATEEEQRRAEAGKTLGNLPAADVDAGESKWSHVDNMDITDMEHAIARMDDREANAFLAEY